MAKKTVAKMEQLEKLQQRVVDTEKTAFINDLRSYIKAKEQADRYKKMADQLKEFIKAKIEKVNTELLFTDPNNAEVFMAKLALTTRDSINSELVKKLLNPDELSRVTKTSTVETLTVKKLETAEPA